ncbi:hypothetical protein [Tenacibaculum ascidiaceicola]|uniref:hypothetical protein n=1 Tax=Tenacibaculum ascidiaceicola TaxID=1699411 RepID=UPI00389489A5
MKKRKRLNLLKLGVFLFGISLLLWNCEKQEEVNHGLENEHFGIPQKYFKKKITLEEVLSNEELYNVLEKNFIRSGEQKKVNEFIPYNYILKVYTSQGILFYNDTIKTYTFPIITNLEKEEHSFFNLLLQEYKGKLYVGVIKYIPSSNWLSNKNEKYEGSFELIDKEGHSKKSYASKSSCETILKAFYAPCGCGGSANGHAPSGAWCCKGSPLLGYDMEFSCSGGGSNGEPGDLDGVSGGLDSGGSSGSAQTDPTEAIYTDTALGINKSLGGTLSDSELEWIDTHPLESFKIVNFIIANEDENKQLTSEAKTFAEQAIKAIKDGGEVDFDDRIINKLINKCAKTIFSELEYGIFENDPIKPEVQVTTENFTKLNFSESILKLFDDSTKTDYTIQNGATNGSAATTLGATTTISDNYLSNATKLSIARTMIHESVHAYINALYSNVIQFNSFTFRQKIEEYAKNNGYTIGTNRFHHEFMGQYVNAMAYSLYEWDMRYGSGKGKMNITKPDDLLGWDYYYAMAFGGLFYKDSSGNLIETDSFKKLIPNQSDRDKIKQILKNEQNGNSSAKGQKC